MFWKDATDQPIENEHDLTLIERVLAETTPINVKLRQVPRLIASLRDAWHTIASLERENADLRRRLRGRNRRSRQAA